MWKGSISFGLVTIPVKLYAATESKDVRFNLLHEECRTPVQYRKWCPVCDREVAQEEITRGYEYERGRYVLVPEEELEAIPVAAGRTLEIVGFVNMAEIDPVYYEKTYYLEPGEGGAKAYALLRRAMEETGRVAVARVVIRTKESLAAIRVFQHGVLALETMHFPDEVRSVAGLTAITEPELRPQELEMAIGLIESLAGPFRPEEFQNEYREAVLELIDAKVAGQDIVTPAGPPPERGRVVDLMEALRASIRAAEGERDPAAAGARAAGPGLVPGPAPGVGPAGPGLVPGPVPGVGPAGPGLAPGPVPGVGPVGPGLAPGPVPGVGPAGPRALPAPGPVPGVGPAGPGLAPGPVPGVGPSGPRALPAPGPGGPLGVGPGALPVPGIGAAGPAPGAPPPAPPGTPMRPGVPPHSGA